MSLFSNSNKNKTNTYEVPIFKEVYSKEIRKTNHGEIIITKCEIKDRETDEVLAFGLTRISTGGKYKRSIAKKLSYAAAMRYFFIKIADGDIMVEEDL